MMVPRLVRPRERPTKPRGLGPWPRPKRLPIGSRGDSRILLDEHPGPLVFPAPNKFPRGW